MKLWHPVSPQVWQGRDDSAESSTAKRLFQTIQQREHFSPVPSGIALLGFECDEGVKRNGAGPVLHRRPMCCAARWRIWRAIRGMRASWIWVLFMLKDTRWRRHSRR